MAESAVPHRIEVAGSWTEESSFLDALLRKDRRATSLLVEQIRADASRKDGKSPGLELLSKAFRGKVLGFLTKFLRERYYGDVSLLVDDAWNRALTRVYLRIEGYDSGRSAFETWVTNQAKWEALNVLKENVPPSWEVPEPQQSDQPRPRLPLDPEALDRALDRLAPREREILELHYLDGLKYVEIARKGHVDLPEQHVRVYGNRAAKQLETYYLEELEEVGAPVDEQPTRIGEEIESTVRELKLSGEYRRYATRRAREGADEVGRVLFACRDLSDQQLERLPKVRKARGASDAVIKAEVEQALARARNQAP